MITLVLYGFLAEKYGKSFEFNATTPREAVALLRANFPSVTKDILNHKPGFKVIVDSKPLSEDQVDFPSKNKVVRLVPAVEGSGKEAAIIVGIALIVITWGAATPAVAAAGAGGAAAAGGAAVTGSYLAGWGITSALAHSALAQIGTALLFSGISQALFKPSSSKNKIKERPENDPSYGFNGPVNTVAQGHNVPVLYGELMVGSQTISSGLRTEQLK